MAKAKQIDIKDLLFISWTSRDGIGEELGEAFKKFFLSFDLGIEVFYSKDTLNDDWYHNLIVSLQKSKYGFFCLTQSAVNSEWVNFELGSILNNNIDTKAIKHRVFLIELSNSGKLKKDKTPSSFNNVKQFCEKELKTIVLDILEERLKMMNEFDDFRSKSEIVENAFEGAFSLLKGKEERILQKDKPDDLKSRNSVETQKIIDELKSQISDRNEKYAKVVEENNRLKLETEQLQTEILQLQTPILKPSSQYRNDPHPAVDLGLSVLWADRNIGADNPWDYGDYFAWGETKQKPQFAWDNYKYANGNYDKLTKYCNKKGYGNNGFTDNNYRLLPEDDAATANWHGEWRMPTIEEFEELRKKCKWNWTENYNGKKGYIVSGNGNQIFLPAAGWRSDTLSDAGSYGNFWSSSLTLDLPLFARYLFFNAGNVSSDFYNDRYYGLSVRAVQRKN